MVRTARRTGVWLAVLGSLCGSVHVPAQVRFVRSQLTWFERSGKKIAIIGNMADYGNIELSPDGQRIAVGVMNDPERGTRDIWIVDTATGQHTTFTGETADENWAVWSRDSRSLVFNSSRSGSLDLYQGAAAASKGFPGDPLLVDREAKWPVSWSTDGRYVLYVTSVQSGTNHIQVLPLFGDHKPFPFRRTEESENWAAFSPDGRWIAYSSTESGPAEVYVAAFPSAASGRKWQVSKGGGTQARWRRDGRELYFLSADRQIVAVSVTENAADLRIGPAQTLFEARYPYGQYHAFDVTADGQRFVVNTLVTPPGTPVVAH
jgi:Tol biopolymer transport system component